MNIVEKLSLVRSLMSERGIDAYYISSSDTHQSEYVGDHFKVRRYLSGFTGSSGSLLVTKSSAYLWTNGIYEVQAGLELAGSGIELLISGKPGVKEVKDFLLSNMKSGEKLLFDGATISAKFGFDLEEALKEVGVTIISEVDFVSEFWADRTPLSNEKAFHLSVKYTGKSLKEKLVEVRNGLVENKCEKMVLITLDDIAWLFNMRGRDIKNTPVALAYAIVSLEKVVLYINEEKLSDELKMDFAANSVEIKNYNDIYEDIKNLGKEEKILIDSTKMNYSLYKYIKETKVTDKQLITTMLKASKNSVEIENSRNAHIKDGVAVVKFTHWLKKTVKEKELSELDAANMINSLRAEQEGFIEPSFTTISAYMSNAAMPHYSATPEKFSMLEAKGLYLCDSGGQYLEGTTDITRTIALGEVSEEIKMHNTLVLKGMINLSRAKFGKGTTGSNLDILARGPLFELGINFNHGTGHGIGHVLGVHEGPHGIRMSQTPFTFEPGLIVTNEPGIYIPGSHGIRIENELLVIPFMENNFGTFYQFETITYAPIDKDAINVSMLTDEERSFLNYYHATVYDKLESFLSEEERTWLREYTNTL